MCPRQTRALIPWVSLAALFAGTAVSAQEVAPAAPASWDATYRSAGNRPGGASLGELVQEGPIGGVWQRSQLLGDLGGIRSDLAMIGLSLSIQETSEDLGNLSGGTQEGFDYDGLTTAVLQLDTQRAFGLRNGLFNVSALDVHGDNLSLRNLGTLQTASGIEADPGVRLWELWYQQYFHYNQVDLKVGQQSLDQEFMVSSYAGLFVNTMFGWPMLPSADLPSGGPAYPLSSLGVRLRFQPAGPWSTLVGVFDDNPSGIQPGQPGDSQVLDNHGTNFRLRDRPLAIAEIQYARPALGSLEYAGEGSQLPGVYRLGFWYDAGRFADQEFGADGLSLANPGSSGAPLLHRGDASVYVVADQLLWRESPQSEEGVGAFFRAMGTRGDRNLVDFSMNAGLTYREPFEHREEDVVGIGMGLADIGGAARALDRDIAAFTGEALPIRSRETFVELTYQYEVVPWWTLQPDVQYVLNPGAGIPDPNRGGRIGNEWVVGLRTNLSF